VPPGPNVEPPLDLTRDRDNRQTADDRRGDRNRRLSSLTL